MLRIKVPIWSKKAVGIAINNYPDDHIIELEILAERKKDGFRYFPNPFTISVAEIKEKKIMVDQGKGNRPMLYIVPIFALHESKPAEDKGEDSEGPQS